MLFFMSVFLDGVIFCVRGLIIHKRIWFVNYFLKKDFFESKNGLKAHSRGLCYGIFIIKSPFWHFAAKALSLPFRFVTGVTLLPFRFVTGMPLLRLVKGALYPPLCIHKLSCRPRLRTAPLLYGRNPSSAYKAATVRCRPRL